MADGLTIESLGLTKEELADRLVERLADQMLNAERADADFPNQIQKRVTERINAAIDEIATKHVLPNMTTYLENFCIQETNTWGEKQGKSVTFIEYLVKRAEAYMQEPVSFQGKTKAEDNYNWSKNTTRVSYLIHQHLQYSIETAMKAALKDANSFIVGGLDAAIKLKLTELSKMFSVSVTGPR